MRKKKDMAMRGRINDLETTVNDLKEVNKKTNYKKFYD